MARGKRYRSARGAALCIVLGTAARIAVVLSGMRVNAMPPVLLSGIVRTPAPCRASIHDADTNARLVAKGWTSLRCWEHKVPADVVE